MGYSDPVGSAPAVDTVLPWAAANRVAGQALRASRAAADGTTVVEVFESEQASFQRNLASVAQLLTAAGVETLLVKTDLTRDFEYGNFDLVVGDDGWEQAIAALKGWGVREEKFWLEDDKLIVFPADGPAAHLHKNMNWFDIPLFDTPALRSRSVAGPVEGLRVPGASDEVLILLAHCLFQNLTLDFADLLRLRDVLTPEVAVEAVTEADRLGWGRGFRAVLAHVQRTLAALDGGESVVLPTAISARVAVVGGLEHSRHLARTGRLTSALRELALRGPLVLRKLLWPHRGQ